MARLLALLLLVCFGASLPTAALPLRVCLLNEPSHLAIVDNECCPDCGHGSPQEDSCCVDVGATVHAPAARSLVAAPDLICMLPAAAVFAGLPALEFKMPMLQRLKWKYRAGPPAAKRAILGIWTL